MEPFSRRIDSFPVAPVQMEQGYRVERTFIGQVEARRAGEVGFEIPGTLAELVPEVGDRVSVGDVLARLDTRRLEARMGEVQSALVEAQVAEKLARSTLERKREARRLNGISQQEEDEAVAAVDAAGARVALAKARVEAVETDLELSVLRAPYEANVDARLMDLGASVTPGAPVLFLEGRLGKEVRFVLGTESAARLEAGQKIDFYTQGIRGTGRLVRTRDKKDETIRAVEAFLGIEAETGDHLRTGSIVSVELEFQVDSPGFWLEREALTEGTRGLWACYTAILPDEAEGVPGDLRRLQRVDLEWMHEEGERVFVRGSLADGDSVVRGGLHKAVPGLLIRALSSRSDSVAF